MAGSFRLTYDARGNVIKKGDRGFEYDAENRLVRVRDKAGKVVEENVYDAGGQRVILRTRDSTTIFIGGIYEEGKTHATRHVRAGPLLVATVVTPRATVRLIQAAPAVSFGAHTDRDGHRTLACVALAALAFVLWLLRSGAWRSWLDSLVAIIAEFRRRPKTGDHITVAPCGNCAGFDLESRLQREPHRRICPCPQLRTCVGYSPAGDPSVPGAVIGTGIVALPVAFGTASPSWSFVSATALVGVATGAIEHTIAHFASGRGPDGLFGMSLFTSILIGGAMGAVAGASMGAMAKGIGALAKYTNPLAKIGKALLQSVKVTAKVVGIGYRVERMTYEGLISLITGEPSKLTVHLFDYLLESYFGSPPKAIGIPAWAFAGTWPGTGGNLGTSDEAVLLHTMPPARDECMTARSRILTGWVGRL